jgi:hypothetical protein
MSVRTNIKVLPKEGAVLKQDEVDFIGAVIESIPANTYLKDLFTYDFLTWITTSIMDDADCNLWLHWQQAEAQIRNREMTINDLQFRIKDLSKHCEQAKADRDEAQAFSAQIQSQFVEAQYNGSAILQQFDEQRAQLADLITVSKMNNDEIRALKSMLYAVVMDTSDDHLKTAARMLVYAWGSE